MIRGIVTPEREAIVPIRVFGPVGKSVDLDAIVDTGFNDFMALPAARIAALDLPFAAPLLATLADGRIIETSSYRATVLWNGQHRDILVVACEGGSLIGMSLIYGCDLHIEAVDGGIVTIELRH